MFCITIHVLFWWIYGYAILEDIKYWCFSFGNVFTEKFNMDMNYRYVFSTHCCLRLYYDRILVHAMQQPYPPILFHLHWGVMWLNQRQESDPGGYEWNRPVRNSTFSQGIARLATWGIDCMTDVFECDFVISRQGNCHWLNRDDLREDCTVYIPINIHTIRSLITQSVNWLAIRYDINICRKFDISQICPNLFKKQNIIKVICASSSSLHTVFNITRAPSQYKDRLIYVWRFPC